MAHHRTLTAICGLLGLTAGTAHAEQFSGALAAGDSTLQSGEFEDPHMLAVTAGSRVRVQMVGANGLDTYLIVEPPAGSQYDNDDANGLNSQIDFLVLKDGLATIRATSSAPGQTGDYTITTSVTEQFGVSLLNHATDSLAKGDQTLQGGEYYDVIPFQGQAGQRILARVASADFDTYLLLIGPNGERVELDDSPNFATNTQIEHVLESSGGWQVAITSVNAGETGAYEFILASLTPQGGSNGGPLDGKSGINKGLRGGGGNAGSW